MAVFIDRLSSLPDAILIDILSLLPINTAATTSVLSRRWYCLWTKVTAIRIDEDYFTMTKNRRFPCVDDILEKLTSTVFDIIEIYVPFPLELVVVEEEEEVDNVDRQCRWSCARTSHQSLLSDWVTHLFRRSVRGFVMRFQEGYESFDWFKIMLEFRVSQCQSLVELQLDQWCDCQWVVDVDEENFLLPNLTRLDVPFNSSPLTTLSRVIKSCPLLRHLQLEECPHLQIKGDNVLEISAQNLESICLHREEENYENIPIQVEIDAPKLKYFDLLDMNDLSKYCFVKRPKDLSNATINRPYCSEYKARFEFLGAMSSVKTLRMNSWIFLDVPNMFRGTLPIFSNLTDLYVRVSLRSHWRGLMQFLPFLPSLKWLYICGVPNQEEEVISWIELEDVPACLSTQVEYICICQLEGAKFELEFISYIQRVANGMKYLYVCTESANMQPKEVQLIKELDFCEELFKFPRSSTAHTIFFSGAYVSVLPSGLKIGALDSSILCCP